MKTISKVWMFASSSGRGNYETLQYADATTSCNCPGWTRRTQPDGSRSCKHTRLIDMGRADSECETRHDYTNDPEISAQVAKFRDKVLAKPAPKQPAIGFQPRKLCV